MPKESGNRQLAFALITHSMQALTISDAPLVVRQSWTVGNVVEAAIERENSALRNLI